MNKDIKSNVLREAKTLDGWPEIKGYDFEGKFNFEEFLKSYLTTGFQATSLGQSIEIIKNMREEDAKIFLAFTSNMGTCGVRENIKYLVKNKFIHVLGTTIGAIEEDIIKWCKERLGGHEYPRIIEFRDTLPKSPAGKILKRILREEEEEAKKEK